MPPPISGPDATGVIALAPAITADAPVSDAAAVATTRPRDLIVAPHVFRARLKALLKPVDASYGLWVNGGATLLSRHGRITDNWRRQGNLTVLIQIGAVNAP